MKGFALFFVVLVCAVELSNGINFMDFLKSMKQKEGCKDQFCTRCMPGWIKNFQMGEPCVKSCPDGFYKSYYPANDEVVCRRCGSNCKECSDWLNCDVCNEHYSLIATAFRRCVTKCPANYITTDTGRGLVCQLDISGCTDESCKACQPGLYLLKDWRNSQCVDFCPKGYFGTEQDGVAKCEKCLYNCERCSSYMTCDKCMPGFSAVSDNNRFYCLKH